MLDFLYDTLDYFVEIIRKNRTKITLVAILCALVLGIWLFFTSRSNRLSALYYSASDEMPRICVSMRVLEEIVSEAIEKKKKIPKECLNLCGLSFVEGYVVDDSGESPDVILVGLQSKARPSLRLDDLIVMMRGIQENTYPFCSLDPQAKNIQKCNTLIDSFDIKKKGMDACLEKLEKAIGPQEVVVGGVPFNSRTAHVMIEADYHMKKVSQGHILLPGVRSVLDIESPNEEPSKSSMSRYWFHIAAGNPTYSEDEGIMWIEQCKVIVLTEKQAIQKNGEITDVAEEDPRAELFAQQFSENFTSAAQFVPVYADLENLYRLRALLLSMSLRKTLSVIKKDFDSYLSAYPYHDEMKIPESLPGLVNLQYMQSKVTDSSGSYIHYSASYVYGGVSQEITLYPTSINPCPGLLLEELSDQIESLRPDAESLMWACVAD